METIEIPCFDDHGSEIGTELVHYEIEGEHEDGRYYITCYPVRAESIDVLDILQDQLRSCLGKRVELIFNIK